MTKLTYPDFRDAMRKHGEYTRARLDGLYMRYLNDDIAECVADALTPKPAIQTVPVATVPPEVKANPRPEVQNFTNRVAQITKVLATHGQPMSLEQIATAMDFTVEHTRKIMLKMGARNLVLVSQVKVKRALQNRYSPVHDAGWRD